MFTRRFKGFMVVSILLAGLVFTTVAQAVTIDFSLWCFLLPARTPAYEQAFELFEEQHPEIKINPIGTPYSVYTQKVTNMFEAGKGPDLLEMTVSAFYKFQNLGFLEVVDNYLDLTEISGSLFPQQEYAEFNGKSYGVVREVTNYQLWYNEKILKEAGLTVPLTGKELLMASEAIVEHTDAQFGLISGTNLGNPAYVIQNGLPIIYGMGGQITRNGKFTVNEPEFIAGVDYIRQIYESPGTPADMPFGQQRVAHIAGKACFVIDGSYWFSSVDTEEPEVAKDLRATLLPFPNRRTTAEMNLLGIGKDTTEEEKKAAAKLLKWMIVNEGCWELVFPTMGTIIAPLPMSVEELQKQPWYWCFDLSLPYSIPDVVTDYEIHTTEIRNMLADYIAAVCTKRMSPQEAMNELQRELEKRFYK